RTDEQRLQIDGIGDQHIDEPAPQLPDQLLPQAQRTSHFGFAGLLKADSQEYRKGRADQRDGREAVVILKALADFPIDLPFHFPLQARVTTARVGAADLDAIDAGDQSPSGLRTPEDTI